MNVIVCRRRGTGLTAMVTRLAVFFGLLSWFLIGTAISQTEADQFPCLDGIETTLREFNSTRSTEFCHDYHPGWIFRLHPYVSDDPLLTNGTLQLLSAIRPPDWRRGQEFTNSFVLERQGPELFAVHMQVGETTSAQIGAHTYFVWMRSATNAPSIAGAFGGKWSPTRLFRCLINSGYGCITYHDVITCPGYAYPAIPNKPAEPLISVRAETPETSMDLMSNYSLAQDLVEQVQQRLLIATCAHIEP